MYYSGGENSVSWQVCIFILFLICGNTGKQRHFEANIHIHEKKNPLSPEYSSCFLSGVSPGNNATRVKKTWKKKIYVHIYKPIKNVLNNFPAATIFNKHHSVEM